MLFQRQAAYRADRGYGQGILVGKRRQNARQAACQHGFAGTGRAGKKQVVSVKTYVYASGILEVQGRGGLQA
ncbi:hypothetical protein GCM10027172_19460 [Halomonas garicola]